MSFPRLTTVASAVGVFLATTGLTVSAAEANPAGTGLVISEVYGGGGNSGAVYAHDFVELYNPTAAPIALSGLSLQYRSASGGVGGTQSLAGSVPAHGFWLVQEAAGSNTSLPSLPTPDASGSLALSGTGGQVLLIDGSSFTGSGDVAGNAALVDMLGWGSSTTTYEGTAPAAGTTNATSVARAASEADTDSNAADFTVGAPTPQNSGADGSGGGTTPPPSAVSIADIQGTGDTSPLAGQTVTTQGVVTADYATGGFSGFYLQTPGQPDTPGASDAVFVFGSAAAAAVHTGESVEVTGKVSEYQGLTELAAANASAVSEVGALGQVTPLSEPWSDLATDAQKEAHEGELIAPQGDWTVSDDYDTNFYGEIGLASGDTPLRQPTDVGTPGSPEAQAAAADDAARGVTLDDGSSWSYTATSHSSDPLPWLTPGTPVSVGAKATFHQPVILDYRNSLWKLQPTSQVVGDGSAVATFSDMRSQNAAPGDVGGDVRLATFNVENFFPTTVDDFLAAYPDASCTTYDDRAGHPISANRCTFADGSAGPRGAATEESYERQLAKIVYGIDHLGASIVSLEEIENAAKFGHDRDWAVRKLVDALNADAGDGTWAYAPSPSDADLPPIAQQDVIRTGFIYKPADVALVGTSHVLTGDSDEGEPFSIAREPLAQGFKAAGAPDSDAFLVVANHLKSKGADADGLYSDCASGGDAENTDPASDQGGFNCTRVHEVQDMWTWAHGQAEALGTSRVFLVGDFNAYTHEDPLEYLYDQGFTDLGSELDPGHSSYSYDGLEGSLDHVLASPDALAMVTGADIWQINAQESVADAYSRYDYNVTNLFDPNSPWAASDHDPEVVGLNLPRDRAVATVTAPPATAIFSKQAPQVVVTVTAPGAQPTGTVTLLDHGVVIGSATLSDGSAVIVLPKKSYKRGAYTLTVAYSGDDAVQPGSTDVTLTITNPAGK